VVGPVAIHDRKPLDPPILRPGFGDIGDAAVEERAFTGEAAEDEVRTLMRRAPPVGRADHPAFTHQLILQGDIVEIAANHQAAIIARADIAVHQHFGIASAPGGEGGRGDLREAGLRQAVGPDRLEQAVIAQVGGDDARDLAAQRAGPGLVGGRCAVAIGGEGGDGDADVGPCAFVGDGAAQRTIAVVTLDRDALHRAIFANRSAEILRSSRDGDKRRSEEEDHLLGHVKAFGRIAIRAPSSDRRTVRGD